jgi:GDP-L-fucose synthase
MVGSAIYRQLLLQGIEPGEIVSAVGYSGNIEFDSSKPDGAPRKWMDSSVIQVLGWQPRVELRQGLVATYQDFLNRL